jgi:large subunit ribosomal protein L22
MIDVKVKSSYLKISPRKMRPLLFNVRGKEVGQAKTFLTFTSQKGARMALALLKSALAIAKENDLEADKMVVKSIYCNDGPRLKRSQPKSKGSAYRITKRMCHLTIVLGEIEMPITKNQETENKKKINKTVPKKETKEQEKNNK